MRRAFSYLRFSSAKQRKSKSLARQRKRIAKWCKKNDVILDTTLPPDKAISAYKGDNVAVGSLGAFLKMVKDTDVEPHSILIVEALDRLSRNVITKAMSLFFDLINSQITIVVMMPRLEILDAESIDKNPHLIYSVINSFALANEESEKKAYRSGKNWRMRRKRTMRLGRTLTKKVPAWVEVSKRERASNPERAAIVRQIYDMADSGMGCRAIARQL